MQLTNKYSWQFIQILKMMLTDTEILTRSSTLINYSFATSLVTIIVNIHKLKIWIKSDNHKRRNKKVNLYKFEVSIFT